MVRAAARLPETLFSRRGPSASDGSAASSSVARRPGALLLGPQSRAPALRYPRWHAFRSLWVGMQEMQAAKAADEFLKSLEYPARKHSILAAAREAGLGPTVQEALDKLPDREYGNSEELTKELNAS